MNVCRFQPLNVLGAIGTLPGDRPDPYAVRAISAVVVLSAQAASIASVDVNVLTQGDGELVVVVGGSVSATYTFAFAAVDPGGVVWIDNSGFTTEAEYAAALLTAAAGQTGLDATATSATITRISTSNTGSDETLDLTMVTLAWTFTPGSGEAAGLDAQTLLPVVTFSFGGAGNMVKVFPELITAAGTYEFYFGSNVDSQASVDPVTGNTLVTVRLPEALGLVSNTAVQFEARSNAPVAVSEVWASIEELLPPPQVDSWEDWTDEEE